MPTSREVKLRETLLNDLNALTKIVETPDRTADDNTNARTLQAQIEQTEADLAEEVKISGSLDRRAQHDADAAIRASGAIAKPENGREQPHQRLSKLLDFGNSDQIKEYRDRPIGTSEPFMVGSFREERALIYGGALSADMVRPQLLSGIMRGNEPLGGRAVRDVLLQGNTTSDSITFVSENVFTNAAAPTLEAVSVSTGAKPESSLTFTQATAPVEIIAHWLPITRNALDDVPQMQGYVTGRLFDGLARTENDQLLNGNGTAPNISGILDQSGIQNLDQTYFTGAAVQNAGAGGPENYNRILRSKTLIATTGDSSASFVIVNPTDWEVLLTLADTTDQYFGMGPFESATNPRIWGLDVVITEAKAAGSYVVGDGTAAQVWDRMAAQLLIFDQHADFAVRNMFVLMAEERVGLAVYRPAAFALVDAI
jgi:HK97 family phage major capsid protein